jgi:hypothetical protein
MSATHGPEKAEGVWPSHEVLWTLRKRGQYARAQLLAVADDPGCWRLQLSTDAKVYAARRFTARAPAIAFAIQIRRQMEGDGWTIDGGGLA